MQVVLYHVIKKLNDRHQMVYALGRKVGHPLCSDYVTH